MKKFLFVLLTVLTQTTIAQAADASGLFDKRFSDAHFVEMHNISRCQEPGWQYPSPVGNQNLTVPQALEHAKERGAILSIKTPAHWTEELGQGRGNGPVMAAHGIYRRTFDDNYFGEFSKLAHSVDDDIEKEFAELNAVPLLREALAPMERKYREFRNIALGYLYWGRPVAHMERVARETTYGSDDKAAIVPFTPCVIDPSSRPLTEVLAEIKTFLDRNRHQVVVLKIENVTNSTDVIMAELQATDIGEYTHKQDKEKLWPTIDELVETNKRFIPFITTDVPAENKWLNAEDDFTWSAKWDFQTKEELLADHHVPESNANFQRWKSGEPIANACYRLPCHLTQGFAGRPDLAQEVNTREVITQRVENIGQGKPTFLALDFIDIGEGFEVVREWNEQ